MASLDNVVERLDGLLPVSIHQKEQAQESQVSGLKPENATELATFELES